nr:copia protein [Tanacetum cinerariifolium]
GSSQNNIDDKGYWDSGCSRHITGNISYLFDYEPFDRGYVPFSQGGCKITGKGTIKTGKLKFENVYFVKDLKYNLFSVSQICDNNNSVLFTDSECIVLGRDFKLIDDTNVLLRTPRQHNMYSIDLNNIVPHKDLTCLVAKASVDECKLWHRRLGTKDAARQEVKKDVSSLRYIALSNWVHDSLLESTSSNAQYTCKADAPESSGNPNPTAFTINPEADPMGTLAVETPIPTNKKDERGIVIRNKVRLVAHGHTQEEGIDYDEVFAPVARIEAIRLFLGYASFMRFTVYQMDVKSAFLYGTIDEEVYVMQPPGFQNPEFPAKEISLRNVDIQMFDQQILPWTRRILGEKTKL